MSIRLVVTGVQHTDNNSLAKAHYVGATSEYLAAAYFLSEGYQVYWPSVQQSCVDFIVDLNGALKRVQVKTGTWNKDHLQCRITPRNKTKKNSSEMYDILVVVSDIGQWIIPSEKLHSSNICLANKSGNYTPRGVDWSEYKLKGAKWLIV